MRLYNSVLVFMQIVAFVINNLIDPIFEKKLKNLACHEIFQYTLQVISIDRLLVLRDTSTIFSNILSKVSLNFYFLSKK